MLKGGTLPQKRNWSPALRQQLKHYLEKYPAGQLNDRSHGCSRVSVEDALTWLPESRIDDPHVTSLIRHKRTVLTGRAWDSAVASAATFQHIRRVERHKRRDEILVQFP